MYPLYRDLKKSSMKQKKVETTACTNEIIFVWRYND